jgi:hypothetical protein
MANLLLFAMVESNSARFGNPPCESASARTGITADFHWDLTRDSFANLAVSVFENAVRWVSAGVILASPNAMPLAEANIRASGFGLRRPEGRRGRQSIEENQKII